MFAWYEKHECIFSKWYIKKNQPSLYMYLRWCNEIYLENPVQYHLIIGKSCINNGYFIKDFSFTIILNSVSLKTCIWYTILNWPNNPQKNVQYGICIWMLFYSLSEKYDVGTMYVQGSLFDGNFVDDNGILMVYFKWLEGEPTRGYYLRIDPLTYRQKTTYGTSSYNSMSCLL